LGLFPIPPATLSFAPFFHFFSSHSESDIPPDCCGFLFFLGSSQAQLPRNIISRMSLDFFLVLDSDLIKSVGAPFPSLSQSNLIASHLVSTVSCTRVS
jgi:hypothetical protein